MNIDQYYGALIGSACGDTLGRATEFMREDEILSFYDDKIVEFQPDRLGVFQFGEYTDDTYLMLCIAKSLIDNQDVDLYDLSERFQYWLKTNGKDCGNLTWTAINLMEEGFDPVDSGRHAWEKSGKNSAGNGGLMRNTAVPLFFANDFDKLIKASELCCKITHFDNRCILSCMAHSIAMYAILHGYDVFDYVWAHCGERDDEFDDLLYEARDSKIKYLSLDGYDMGYTYLSLKVALCAVLNYDNYKDPIIEIVNKGGDADTNGAIAGGLLGAKFGLNSIPKSWQDNLLGFSDLYDVAEKLYNHANKNN